MTNESLLPPEVQERLDRMYQASYIDAYRKLVELYASGAMPNERLLTQEMRVGEEFFSIERF